MTSPATMVNVVCVLVEETRSLVKSVKLVNTHPSDVGSLRSPGQREEGLVGYHQGEYGKMVTILGF